MDWKYLAVQILGFGMVLASVIALAICFHILT